MFPFEGKICLVMVKFRSRFKSFHIVAVEAVGIERFLMVVVMTRNTGFVQAQEGIRPFFYLGIGDILRYMAFIAIDHCMFALQGITRELMVKSILIKSYHIKISAVVVTMALGTVLFNHVRIGMVPVFFVD